MENQVHDDITTGEEHPAMDTTYRGWELTRDVGERGQTTCNHSRCQTTTENNVTTRKYEDCHQDEDCASRGKCSTSTEDDVTGSVAAPPRKGRIVGRRYRHNKIECRAHRNGRSRDVTKPSHHATRGICVRKEHPDLGAVLENHRNVSCVGTSSDGHWS
jgi:hypothetical protein